MEQLMGLPNVSHALAQAIIDKRPFLTFLDFDKVLATALTPQQRTEVYRKAWVHVNLNTAPDEEIRLIPGVGDRMLREFKEYRPYASLAQFRREIGKYVDASELARLESYVFVPVDLNTAPDSVILTIPGVGARMLREFKEYRPYENMEKFRREIGKYVDSKEVARLERYVTIGKK
jgi:DNA uptake protein ComE-like DNA-binding protein